MRKIKYIIMIVMAITLLVGNISLAAWVIRDGDKVFIEDRRGERWDVSQAQTLGFEPHGFQYGIGKNAFTPLGEKDVKEARVASFFNARIIGISINGKAHAYSIDRLRYHETANTTIGGKAIVAGY